MLEKKVVRIHFVMVCLGLLLFAGCASFLKPEVGSVAHEKARTALTGEVSAKTWETDDLRVTYTLNEQNGIGTLSGKLVFDRSIRDSFPAITRFFLYLSFLDDSGKVLGSFDITPAIPTFGNIPENLQFSMNKPLPPGSKALTFHYFGEFRANPVNEGGTWSIHHFPFD